MKNQEKRKKKKGGKKNAKSVPPPNIVVHPVPVETAASPDPSDDNAKETQTTPSPVRISPSACVNCNFMLEKFTEFEKNFEELNGKVEEQGKELKKQGKRIVSLEKLVGPMQLRNLVDNILADKEGSLKSFNVKELGGLKALLSRFIHKSRPEKNGTLRSDISELFTFKSTIEAICRLGNYEWRFGDEE